MLHSTCPWPFAESDSYQCMPHFRAHGYIVWVVPHIGAYESQFPYPVFHPFSLEKLDISARIQLLTHSALKLFCIARNVDSFFFLPFCSLFLHITDTRLQSDRVKASAMIPFSNETRSPKARPLQVPDNSSLSTVPSRKLKATLRIAFPAERLGLVSSEGLVEACVDATIRIGPTEEEKRRQGVCKLTSWLH